MVGQTNIISRRCLSSAGGQDTNTPTVKVGPTVDAAIRYLREARDSTNVEILSISSSVKRMNATPNSPTLAVRVTVAWTLIVASMSIGRWMTISASFASSTSVSSKTPPIEMLSTVAAQIRFVPATLNVTGIEILNR